MKKFVKVDADQLITILNAVNHFPVTGPVHCSNVVGINQMINQMLSGEGESEPHTEQRT